MSLTLSSTPSTTISPFPLTLTPQVSVLDGITLREPVRSNILEKLIHSDLLATEWKDKSGNAWVHENEKVQLQKYRSKVSKGYAHITYNIQKGNSYGRVYAENAVSLGEIKRQTRHTLVNDIMVDIDVANCHPELLYQIMLSNNVPCPLLEKYVKNRDYYLKQVIDTYGTDRDSAKTLFIILLYGGRFETWADKRPYKLEQLPLLTDFIIELHKLSNLILSSNPEIERINRDIKKAKGKVLTNVVGSVCSFYLQEWERRVLEVVYQYAVEKQYIRNGICVLCYDGIMLENHLYDNKILTEFSEIVMKKLGFVLKFTSKPLDEPYIDLDKHIIYDLHSSDFCTGVASDYFKMMYGDKFINVDEQLYFYNGVYWETDDKKHSNLHRFVDKTFYSHLVGYLNKWIEKTNMKFVESVNEEQKNTHEKTLKRLSETLKMISCLRQKNSRNSYVDDIIIKLTSPDVLDSDPYLFAFNNAIYDLQQMKFIKPRPEFYITLTSGYDYEPHHTGNIDALLDSIFPNEQVKDYYLTALSTGLSGIQVQNFFIATGPGGNGKSVIHSLFLKTIGNYGYELPSICLMKDIQDGANPAIACIDKKRGVISSEPPSGKSVCTSTIKRMTGESSLPVRNLYQSKVGIKNLASYFMDCNTLPKLDEIVPGVIRRIRATPFDTQFMDEEKYYELPEEKRQGKGIANAYYITDQFKLKERQTLFFVLVHYFQKFLKLGLMPSPPDACAKLTHSYLAASDHLYDWFCDRYEQVAISTPMPLKELYNDFKTSEFFNNLNKVDKRQLNQRQFLSNINQNVFMKEHIKLRDTHYNGHKLSVDSIVGWKLKNESTDAYATVEEEEEVVEVQIEGKKYFTPCEINGTIYDTKPDGEVGNKVGRFVNKIAKFNKDEHYIDMKTYVNQFSSSMGDPFN